MPPRSTFRQGWLFLIFFATNTLSAQKHPDIHQYDAQLSRFFEHQQRDSFLYYINLKAERAKQVDSLDLWAWARYKTQRFFAEKPEEALSLIEQTFSSAWRKPLTALEAEPFLYLRVHQANYLKNEGRILSSIQTYQEALAFTDAYQYSDFDIVESIFKPLGNNYIRLGENDKAIAVFQKALALGGENEARSGLYSNVGIAYWNKGDYLTAEANYRQGLKLQSISPVKRGLLLGRLAETLLDMGKTEEAASTAESAIRLLRSEGNQDPEACGYRAHANRVAGLARTKLGQFTPAERCLKAALLDDRTTGADTRETGKDYIALSKLYLVQGRSLQAIDAANQALSAVLPKFKPASGKGEMNAAPNPDPNQFYEENTIFEALSAKAAAAQLQFEKSGNTAWLETALECHDLAWKAEYMLRRVFQYSSSKLNLQKDARIREESAMQAARLLFEKTGNAHWFEKAFAIAERSKAALLLEALQDNLLRQKFTGPDKRFETLTALRQNLAAFDKNLLLEPDSTDTPKWRIAADDIRGQIAGLEEKLRQDYPVLTNIPTNDHNWLPVAEDFTEGEMMIEYFISDHWVDILAIEKGKPGIWKRIANDAAFQDLTQRYLHFFEHDYTILNDPAGYFQTAYQLWQLLLPAESNHVSLLSIMPDGILNFVPFEALVTDPSAPTLRNAAYLLRRQALRYAWSLAVLRQQKHLKSSASSYLLSLAPGFKQHERGLAPLAPADFDWRGITGLDILSLKGQSADFHHFIDAAADYRVIHFSTHAFASGNPRIELVDRSLLLPDLYALPLQAELVMLSACETGLGHEEKGEGVMSLARAFAQAGAAGIVSSLWSVNDESTSRLLRYFYRYIGDGQNTVEALQKAKLAYLSDPDVPSGAQTPYFWAGMVIVGDARCIKQPWGWINWGLAAGAGLFLITLSFWLWRWRRTRGLRSKF